MKSEEDELQRSEAELRRLRREANATDRTRRRDSRMSEDRRRRSEEASERRARADIHAEERNVKKPEAAMEKRAREQGEEGSRGRRRRESSSASSRMTPEERQQMRAQQQIRRAAEREHRNQLRETNKEIILCTYLFIAIFVVVIGYMGWFMHTQADTYKNNSYNSRRQTLLEEQCVRGDILASDGTVLAETIVDEDGSETRTYPQGRVFAHVVGYSSEGTSGLESQAAASLLDSHETILNKILNELRGRKETGDSVQTTLNVRIQEAAYEALGDYQGAVVAMDAETGEILAMVSKPDFDPNTLSEYYDELINDEDDEGTLVNRATYGLYPPGSTFKVLTTLEYMREYPKAWKNFSFECSGIYNVDDLTIQCYGQTAHGELDLAGAFACSCNGAYASIGRQLDFSDFYSLCESFGFNQTISGVSMTKSIFRLKNNKSEFLSMQTSIGQGETQVTPLLNCMIAASVANDGVMMKPYLIDSVMSSEGNTVKTSSPSRYADVMSKKEAGILQDMMRRVVTDGTGSGAAGSGYTAYGKTGSAEVTKEQETDAWFIGYGVSDTTGRKIAVSVVVENAGGGGSVAAPIAREVLEAAFN